MKVIFSVPCGLPSPKQTISERARAPNSCVFPDAYCKFDNRKFEYKYKCVVILVLKFNLVASQIVFLFLSYEEKFKVSSRSNETDMRLTKSLSVSSPNGISQKNDLAR